MLRAIIWFLASLSFACLLGHFYGFWSMQVFTPCILLPATILLGLIAWKGNPETRQIIVQGAIGGLVAAVLYDLFRLPFVMAGKPLFAVFPKFGQMLLYGQLNDNYGPAVQIAGWIYHFSNGAALGIMAAAMMPFSWSPKVRFAGSVAWAVMVEIFLLLSPYYTFFKLKMDAKEFLVLTLSAHIVFGIILGIWLMRQKPITQQKDALI